MDDDNECSDNKTPFTPFTLEPSKSFDIENAKVRKFKVQKINFLSQSYIEWEDTALSEPPLTLGKTNEELYYLIPLS